MVDVGLDGAGSWQAAPGLLSQQAGGTDLGFLATPAPQPCDGIPSGQPGDCSSSQQPEEPLVEALWGPWGSGPSLCPWEATSSCPGSCSPRAGPTRSLHLPVGPEHPGCVGAAELGQPGLRALHPMPSAGASLWDLWYQGRDIPGPRPY